MIAQDLLRASGYDKGTGLMERTIERFSVIHPIEQIMMGMLAVRYGSYVVSAFMTALCENNYAEEERHVLLLLAIGRAHETE